MKFPLVLRKTYEEELDRATDIIVEKNRVIAVQSDELAIANRVKATLQDRNEKLNEALAIAEEKLNKLDKANKDLDDANKKLIELFNDANRKNWCNNESSRQLKRLSEEIIESDKINKTNLATYIYNISQYVGGGIPAEIKVMDDIK